MKAKNAIMNYDLSLHFLMWWHLTSMYLLWLLLFLTVLWVTLHIWYHKHIMDI